MCFAGDEADLQLTANTQPAILTVSVAAYRAMRSEGIAAPDSLPDTALVNILHWSPPAYSILQKQCGPSESVAHTCRRLFRLVWERWRRSSGSILTTVEAGCAEAAQGQVCSPANINSPSQIVIAGKVEAVDRACEILKAKGAKRAIRLNVSAPFHCALMMPAQERLAGGPCMDLDYGDFEFPIVHNVDADVNNDSVSVREA